MKKGIIIFSIIIILILSALIYEFYSYYENIPILAYHNVISSPEEDTDIDLEIFKKQMKFLHILKFRTISLDEFYKWKYNKIKIRRHKVILTFDDGKESFYTNVLPILEEYGLKSTVFVIYSRIGDEGYLTEDQLNDIRLNHPNVTIASHSYDLHQEELATSDKYDIYNEDMEKYENHNYYAYPFGISTEEYKKALIDNHFKLAFKYSPGKWSNKKEDNYSITRVPIYNSTSFFKYIVKVTIKH